MSSAILSHLLNLLGDPTGTLKTLLRKGLAALRGLFGRGKGFLREVLKRVVAFWTKTAKPAADAARQKVGDALLSLARRAKAAWPQDPTPPAGSPNDLDTALETAEPLSEEPTTLAGPEETTISCAHEAGLARAATPPDSALSAGIPSPGAPSIVSTAVSDTTSTAVPNITRTATPNVGSAETPSRNNSAHKQLAAIAPLLRRTLLRALQGDRTAPISPPTPSPILR